MKPIAVECIKSIPHLCEIGETGTIEMKLNIITVSGYGYWIEGCYQPWWSTRTTEELLFKLKKPFWENEIYKQIGNYNINNYFKKIKN